MNDNTVAESVSTAHVEHGGPVRSWLSRNPVPLLCLALGLAVFAQALTDKRFALGLALAACLAGGLLYALVTHTMTSERVRGEPSPRMHINVSFLVWGLVFSALSFFSFRDNQITLQGLIPWILSVLLCFLALPSGMVKSSEERGTLWQRVWGALQPGRWRISWTTWGLIIAFLVGTFLRFYRLSEIPGDLGWDLPYNYTDAQRILRGEHLVFFPDNFGREGMFFYLIVAVSKLVPLSPYSIRITSALVGIATIPAVYLLGKECLDRETAAYAALFMAINKWHIVLMRSGYRVSLMPLFSILVLYGVARGLRRGQPRDWAWGGLFLGLGLWTYKAFIFVVPTVIGCVVIYALLGLYRRSRLAQVSASDAQMTEWAGDHKAILKGLGLLLLVTIVVAMPMIRFIVDSPETYLARELQGLRLVDQSVDNIRTSRLQLYARNWITSLLMFNYEGDGNSRFGVPLQRHMGFISGIFFILGVAGAIARFRKGGNALLVLAVLGLLVPMVISMLAGEKPNCFRSSGVIGPSLLLAAITLRTIRCSLSNPLADFAPQSLNLESSSGANDAPDRHTLRLHLNLALLPLLVSSLILLAETRETLRFYFHDFRLAAPDVANYSVALELARAIIDFEDGPAYIKAWPHWYDGRAVSEHLDAAGRAWTAELYELKANSAPLAGFRGKMLVLMHPQDKQSLATLKAFFPRSAVKVEHYPRGEPSLVAFCGER